MSSSKHNQTELHNTAVWWGSSVVIFTGKHFSTGKLIFTGKLFRVVIVEKVKFNISSDKWENKLKGGTESCKVKTKWC